MKAYSVTIFNRHRDGSETYYLDREFDLLSETDEDIVSIILKNISNEIDFSIRYANKIDDISREIGVNLFIGGKNKEATESVFQIRSVEEVPQDRLFKGQFYKKKKNVLIVCTANSCRSQIAEGYLRKFYSDVIEVHSAGLKPGNKTNANAIKVMEDFGIDINKNKPKSLDSLNDEQFDFVISVCDEVAGNLPCCSERTIALDFGVPDPAAFEGSLNEDDLKKMFVESRNLIFSSLKGFADAVKYSNAYENDNVNRKEALLGNFEDKIGKELSILTRELMKVRSPKEQDLICTFSSDAELILRNNIGEFRSDPAPWIGLLITSAATLFSTSFNSNILPAEAWRVIFGITVVYSLYKIYNIFTGNKNRKNRQEIINDIMSDFNK